MKGARRPDVRTTRLAWSASRPMWPEVRPCFPGTAYRGKKKRSVGDRDEERTMWCSGIGVMVILMLSLLTGCTERINLFSSSLDSGLCRNARAGNEDFTQCMEAQQSRRR